MGIDRILAGLDPKQRAAVQSESNAVVSAGAGSGKTRVIASRYAWLVMEKGIPVEEIITLTFTNKAVNEMYRRIYGLLAAQTDNPKACEAAANFNRATIVTLDSFCTGVARIAARRYGIRPDFVCDPEGARRLAMESALPFVLNNRDNPGLRALMGDKKIQALAEELFAEAVLSAASIATPLDFMALWKKQRDEILRAWNCGAPAAVELARAMIAAMEELEKPGEQIGTLRRQGAAFPPVPDIQMLLGDDDAGETAGARRQVREFFDFLGQFCALSFSGRLNAAKEIIRENRDALRELKTRLESIALFALSAAVIREVFLLLEEFQRDFSQKKREAGILTFGDIARLAVDALSRYPDLRQFYNRNFSAIMIDEFQDNNKLQRDLIFLLAEKAECTEPGIPGLAALHPNKMIFVGDEKQSIYRFRGADVSVFRALSGSFAEQYAEGHISLDYNYRSSPVLIRAFNYFFGGLLPGGAESGEPVFLRGPDTLPDYEARYEAIAPGLKPGEPDGGGMEGPPPHFCFLDQGRTRQDDPGELSPNDLEAAFVAMKIRELTDQGHELPDRNGGTRKCEYGDIAVLLRTTGHQIALEKQFQNFGIPYNTDDPAGLFSDAPINDLYHFLRLLIYPQDRAAYAALIRSPFCGLSDLTLTVCMLDESGVPFNEKLEPDIPEEEREAFRKSRERYQSLAEDARTKTAAELLTRLWYEEGYRYETLWSPPARIYGELFDFFFELARQSDQRGETPAEFLDNFERIIKNDERIKELRVPVEREGGVRIMTVHKSKGLEFPVVFIPGCQGKTRIDSAKTFFFSEEWGISLKLPGAEELPGGGNNYFYLLQQEEEKKKAAAELRRLLYVAMTRAESRLFLSAILPPSGDDEGPEGDGSGVSWIPERLAGLRAKKAAGDSLPGFLDLLLPALCGEDRSLFTFETIPPYSRAELSRLHAAGRREAVSMAETARAAAAFYDAAPAVSPPRFPAPVVNASALRYIPEPPPAPVFRAGTGAPAASDELEILLRQGGLEPAEFGTIVHACLEARFRGKRPRLPPKFLARLNEKTAAAVDVAARAMAENFLASELGRQSLADPRREAEFPILTMTGAGDAKVPIQGVIDLLFESGGVMQVVDFKTDKTEAPERHLAQLAVYRRAIADISGKPVRAWLFYLRSGTARELTADLEKIDLEKIVKPFLLEQAETAG
ncbi:MAG: UvrD-helicase domain-containing protein [Treponema sp.]|nr:UvrD-helicase domain-containing protein [Treponema sp.]